MAIIDCSALIEPHFHWQSHPFVSQDPARGDEFQEFGLKWRGPGFSFVSAPGWRMRGAGRLDAYPLDCFAAVASIVDVSDLKEIGAVALAERLKGVAPKGRRILVLRTGHSARHRNSHLAYWREVPRFAAACANQIAREGFRHVVLDIPCDELPARRPLDDGYVPNANQHFRAALHAAGLLVTENAENLVAIEQSEVFFCSLPLAIPRASVSPVRPIAFTQWPSDEPVLLDVSTPMFNHWRWYIDVDDGPNFAAGADRDEIHFTIRGHGFTHCDAPRHMRRDGMTIQEMPNWGLDAFTGEANIVDLSDLPLPTPITAELISARAKGIRMGDIVVLRSDLTNRMGYESTRWHLVAPNLEVAAAEWLMDQGIKAIALDFPQDFVAREMPKRHVFVHEFHTHLAVFARNIPFIEDFRDIGLAGSDRTHVLAIPLKTTCIDGAMMRALFVRW
ncbi:MAG: hypothetical protein GC150_02515 [Rhizobiales bacterium]|nr:hypothetical protein [Hyphomicrobiales bacterium]